MFWYVVKMSDNKGRMVSTTVRLEEQTLKKLKINTIEHGTSIQSLFEQWVHAYLADKQADPKDK